jgi:DNA-binding response OmpR family regulator
MMKHDLQMSTTIQAPDPPQQRGWADLARGEACCQSGHCGRLSLRETELLRYLARQAGRPVSRQELLLHVWQLDPHRTCTRTIDMHIAHLRSKLGDDARRPRLLFTLYGRGYMLAVEGQTKDHVQNALIR